VDGAFGKQGSVNLLGKFIAKLRPVFDLFKRADGKIHAPVIAAFIFINGLVLVNAILHDPRVGYDSGQHLSYIMTLAAKGRLPSFEESAESFNPPLSYALPALLLRVMAEARGDTPALNNDLLHKDAGADVEQSSTGIGRRSQFLLLGISAKSAQLLNWLFSVGLTLFVLKICELTKPGKTDFKFWTLLLLGMLPVYYKTFAFVRGEPLAAFLVVVAAYYFLRMLLTRDFRVRHALTLGLVIGLAILARQWSFLILPAFAFSALLSWRSRSIMENKALGAALATSVLVAALVGGWFYVSYPWGAAGPGRMSSYLAKISGDPYWTQVSELSFSVGNKNLFTSPVRDSLSNQIIPIFYSEIWGDYWGYFVTGKSDQPENMRRYLGRVNLVSLLPTAIFLAGLGLGVYGLIRSSLHRRETDGDTAFGLLTLLIAWSLIGYSYLLAVIPNTSYGTGAKATYMLQIFPFLSILAAGVLTKAMGESRRLYWGGLVLLVGMTLHNLPTMITHYIVTSGRPQLAW
jgi:hypothetical protein